MSGYRFSNGPSNKTEGALQAWPLASDRTHTACPRPGANLVPNVTHDYSPLRQAIYMRRLVPVPGPLRVAG